MPKFEGSIEEFRRLLGPRIRNLVNGITREHRRRKNNICEHCNREAELESAHIKGRGRNIIIDEILSRHQQNNIIKCDLTIVEQEILNAHLPIEDNFLFLCRECHTAYDQGLQRRTINAEEGEISHRQVHRPAVADRPRDGQHGDLLRRLQSIGMECFVNYFEKLRDESIPTDQLMQILMAERNYTEAASRTRVAKARRIIEDGCSRDALMLIMDARRVRGEIRERARAIYITLQ